MTLHSIIKNHFRWIVLLFLITLSTILVFFSVISFLILPPLWGVSYLLTLFTQKPVLIFLKRTFSFAISGYFFALISLIIYTPECIKTVSLILERYSFFALFNKASFMYGRLFIAFIVFWAIFIPLLWIGRKKNQLY